MYQTQPSTVTQYTAIEGQNIEKPNTSQHEHFAAHLGLQRPCSCDHFLRQSTVQRIRPSSPWASPSEERCCRKILVAAATVVVVAAAAADAAAAWTATAVVAAVHPTQRAHPLLPLMAAAAAAAASAAARWTRQAAQAAHEAPESFVTRGGTKVLVSLVRNRHLRGQQCAALSIFHRPTGHAPSRMGRGG